VFNPGSAHVGFMIDRVALGQVFSPNTSVFPCQFHSTCAPLHEKKTIKLIIFITVLYNETHGCGASVASAAGPFTTKKRTPSARSYRKSVTGIVRDPVFGHKVFCLTEFTFLSNVSSPSVIRQVSNCVLSPLLKQFLLELTGKTSWLKFN
jgi:hypothetical protein